MTSLTVYISGCHSGPNPSPGLGLARSLRQAYPHARLIAKDHSLQCSSIHDPVFDDLWINRPWNELDLDIHRSQIEARLAEGAIYLPGLDLEVRWLGEIPPERVLVPPAAALRATFKPEFPGARNLPVHIPAWISYSDSARAVHSFCRAHDWRVWVKGAAYEAQRAENWPEVHRAAERLQETWGPSEIHLQEDIRGWEVSIVFAAHKGILLDALFMEKRLLTETGKTWAGALSELSPAWTKALRDVVAELEWTGGSELEFVRDAQGRLWLMDWNPRFPAWIHGCALAGRNLPARLVEEESGAIGLRTRPVSFQFTRVVQEIPVRDPFPLPSPPPVKLDRIKGGKHPSGMPLMMRRLMENKEPPPRPPGEPIPDLLSRDLREVLESPDGPTPYRAVLPETAQRRFGRLADFQEKRPHDDLCLHVAYSCKTNPAPEFLRLAHEHGMWIEVISVQELEWVLANGFDGAHTLYNGPVPLPGELMASGRRLRAAFADSVEAFEKYKEIEGLETVGARLRPAFVDSRFGIAMEEFEEFESLKRALDTLPGNRSLGLSFHIQSSRIGLGQWGFLLPGLIEEAVAFEELTGRCVDFLDLGGGHSAWDEETWFSPDFFSRMEEMKRRLCSLRDVAIEPGKALVEPCGVVVSTVLEIRKRGSGRREAVVDASIAEVPLIDAFPHRMLAASGDRLEPLSPGDDAVLGRLCMENDILSSRVDLPSWLREGDRIVICDCGAYDTSMAYPFGKGIRHESSSNPASSERSTGLPTVGSPA